MPGSAKIRRAAAGRSVGSSKIRAIPNSNPARTDSKDSPYRELCAASPHAVCPPRSHFR